MIVAAFAIFAGLSVFFLTLMLPDWTQFIPGGQQDTRLFLWNLWWFPEALHKGLNPFHTAMLFHPYGVSLLSHDYPLWNNVLGLTAQALGAGLALSANLTFWITWALNGFSTYLLASELLRSRKNGFWPAILAGLFVMTHSYTLARMMQNWGQFNLFSLPLFLWTFLRLRRTRNLPDAVLAGAALAFNAACHYYFLIYAVSLWIGWFIYKTVPFRLALSSPSNGRVWGKGLGLILAVIGASTALWITQSHPGAIVVLGQRIRLTTPANALLVMWVGLAIIAISWAGAHFSVRQVTWTRRDWIEQGAVLLSAAFFLLPLLLGAAEAILSGDYPKQSILWKTHLRGSDLFGVFFPNPLQAWWGPSISRWLESQSIHPQDQAAMIGWVVLAIVIATRFWKTRDKERLWFYLAIGSTVMAMGTYLHIGAWNTWCPLPFYVWRLLPVLGNVRVPERWMALGAVAWAMVLALGIAILCSRYPRWRKFLLAGTFALLLLENWPGVPQGNPPADEPVYQALRSLPPGSVLPLPFYVGDSSIGAGNAGPSRFIFPWDHLGAQIHHQHPIVGGFIGRIPRRILNDYKKDTFIGTIIRLEEATIEHPPVIPSLVGCQSVESLGFDYVLLYPEAMSGAGWNYVRINLPLKLQARQPDIALYQVDKFTCSKMLKK